MFTTIVDVAAREILDSRGKRNYVAHAVSSELLPVRRLAALTLVIWILD